MDGYYCLQYSNLTIRLAADSTSNYINTANPVKTFTNFYWEETWTEETSSYIYGCECHLGKFFAGIQMARIDKKINTKSSLVNISKIEDDTNFNF